MCVYKTDKYICRSTDINEWHFGGSHFIMNTQPEMCVFVHFTSYIILTSVHAPCCHCVVNFILYLTRFKLSICFSAPQATTTCAYLYITRVSVCVCVCDVTLYRCWTWMFVHTRTYFSLWMCCGGFIIVKCYACIHWFVASHSQCHGRFGTY